MIQRRPLANGRIAYVVRVGYGGEQRTFHRYDDAEEYEAQQKRNRRRAQAGIENVKPDLTFADLVKLWEANFNPSAWRQTMVAYATKRWGKVKVREIQPEAVGAWINSLEGRTGPLSEKTRSHVLETMRQVLNAGVEWGYLTKSPARRGAFKAPSKRARVSPIQPFETWAEVLRVADACASRQSVAGPFVRFACATGLRCPGEIVDLQWSQVDLKSKSLTVGSKTSAGHRTVPLSIHALAALDDLPRSLSGRVFVGKRGGRFDYLNWRDTDWRDALTDCGLPHRTPYEMRHTFATLALAEGASIDDVATVMGHDDISVAYSYYRKWIRAMADRLRLTLDQIGESCPDTESSRGAR